MSDVREAISDYIMNHVAINPNTRFADLTWKQTDHAAGDILAIIREALLSDAAVEAAGKNLYNNRMIELDQSDDDDWDILPWQDEWIEGATDALIGALDAAGITEGDDE